MSLTLPSFLGANVLVVGDVMLDRYWHGWADRVSQEAPVPVVDVQVVEDRPGGAANVALNVAALGARCTLVGIVGEDDAAGQLEEKLTAAGVQCVFLRAAEWPTIVKLRVVAQQQQMLRMDFERPLDPRFSEELLARADAHLERCDVLVLEDYDKGTLAAPASFIDLANARSVRTVVDPKFKAFSAYSGAFLLKPNSVEFQRLTGGWRDYAELVEKATQVANRFDLGSLLVTRGADGMTLVHADGRAMHLPARGVDVFDETGAGDTVTATVSASLAVGASLEDAATLANIAASLVVAKSGTATVTPPELGEVIGEAVHADRGVMTAEELHVQVERARERGERIVFTNGCFDILHAGHVSYLAEAAALGDRLVVAVNDDASTHRIKGAGRPVNTLAQRQHVLAALGCVDWVVGFSGDTPLPLLDALKPDLLVKGGDYALEDVVGADVVRGYGGEVRVLGKVDDVSTSAIVERVKKP